MTREIRCLGILLSPLPHYFPLVPWPGIGLMGIRGMIGQGDGVLGYCHGDGLKGHDRPRRWVLGYCHGDGLKGHDRPRRWVLGHSRGDGLKGHDRPRRWGVGLYRGDGHESNSVIRSKSTPQSPPEMLLLHRQIMVISRLKKSAMPIVGHCRGVEIAAPELGGAVISTILCG